MGLHPLETRGWGEFRDYSIMVARKLLIYLDLKIKQLEREQNESTKPKKD